MTRNTPKTTIGLLINHYVTGTVAHTVWSGVVDAARECGVNLICFAGGRLRDPRDFAAQANILYELVDVGQLDGLIIWSSVLEVFVSRREMQEFIDRFRSIPLVSGETAFSGVPAVLMDNYNAMREAVLHLIEEHNCRKIAFIQGPEGHAGAQERYQGYKDTLHEYGLFHAELITAPCSTWYDGTRMLKQMLDTQQLRAGIDFEAVIAPSGGLVMSALPGLQALGVTVPDDVALVGFDDVPDMRTLEPPITTIQPPFYAMGRKAVTTLLKVISGEPVPERISMPAGLLIQQSCGCPDREIARAAAEENQHPARPLSSVLKNPRETLSKEMGQILDEPALNKRLVDAFAAHLTAPQSGAFATALKDMLEQMLDNGQDVSLLQEVISVMRRSLAPHLNGTKDLLRAENAWHQARVLIGKTRRRVQTSQMVQEWHQSRTMSRIGARLITTFDVEELMSVLADDLPRLGIPGCYLSLYEHAQDYAYPQPAPEWSRLMLAYHAPETRQLEPGGTRYPSRQLLPDGMLPKEEPYSLAVEPLYFRKCQIGVIVFELGPHKGEIYERLREEISSALQGALLVQRVQARSEELAQYRDHLEELVKKRTSALERANVRLHQEISERAHAENALRLSEQQYRMLAENVQDGIVIMQQAQLLFANAVFTAMSGYSPEQLRVKTFADLFPHEKQRNKAAVPKPGQWQTEMLKNNGELLWTEVEQKDILWNSQPALLLTIRNITERKRREQRLEDERTRLEQENLSLKSTIKERFRFGPLVGKSSAMQRVYELIVSAAASDVNVLLVGESGTGKELVARTLHQVSSRKGQAFVPVNCASIPESLFEREFFGHRKGAFTGADRDKPGFFDRAHRGTLFLDEVTELQPGTQAKLLRVLQDGEYTPLGSPISKQADVLIVAATNKDCQHEIEQGRLRKDFFYRVGIIDIPLPPLGERKDDLPLLLEHLLEQYRQKQTALHGDIPPDVPTDQSMLPGELIQALYAYHWPGNVRELQNVVQRYLATRDLSSLSSLLRSPSAFGNQGSLLLPASNQPLPDAVNAFEKQTIAEALSRNRYHTRRTAQTLGIPVRTLQYKLKLYGLKA